MDVEGNDSWENHVTGDQVHFMLFPGVLKNGLKLRPSLGQHPDSQHLP